MKKCVIIMNPESGKRKKITSYQKFYDILRKHGYDTEIILTREQYDAERIMKVLADDIDLVVSAGGDGTLNEIVSGNMQRKKKLVVAPLPMGSTNDVGNMYGLNKSVYDNLEILLQGKPKKVDVCYINDKPFVYVACFGDYLDMAYETPRKLKKKYGELAYFLYALKQFRPKITSHKIKYKVDGKEFTGEYSFIFITNSSRIAGQPDVYYDVKLDDKKFEVCLANASSVKEMVKLMVLATSVDVKTIPNVTYYQTDNFEVEFLSKAKDSWCVDGEEYKLDSHVLTFRVEQSMKMLVPNENMNKLFNE
jgi:YegS/Rv2252/BmrU family lipid kinase